MLSMLIIALIMVCLSDISLAGEWTKKGDIPVEITQCGAVVFNNEAYVFGGPHGGQNTAIKYNPVTDTWTRLADMPNTRQGFSAIEINGKMYMIGCMNNAKNLPLEIYDPITDTWESKSVMPNFRGLSGVVAIGHEIYVLGGYKFIGNKNFLDIHVYNTVTDTWTEKKPMPLLLDSFLAIEYNGKIITFGGFLNEPNGNFFPVSQVWEYDPVKEIWTQKADMLTARAFTSQISIFNINNKFAIVGGTNNNFSGADTVLLYDPFNDTWDISPIKIPIPVHAHSLVQIGDKGYLFGGRKDNNNPINMNTYVYNPFPQPTTSISPKESLIGTWGKIKSGNQ